MKISYQAIVTYEIDDVESFKEAEEVFIACVRADSAIDGVVLVSIKDADAVTLLEDEYGHLLPNQVHYECEELL